MTQSETSICRPEGRAHDQDAARASAWEALAFLKRASELDELLLRSVRIDGGWLIPLADAHRSDAATIELLGRWRTAHMAAHPSQFTVTREGTRRWLADAVLDHPHRIVFLVADPLGRPMGQLGFTLGPPPDAEAILGTNDTAELGFVIRGEPGLPGLMAHAVMAALEWCRETLAPAAIYALTFSDNERARAFFRRCGGTARGAIPLTRQTVGDRIEFRPLRSADESVDQHFELLVFEPERSGGAPDTGPVELAGPSITPREASYALDAARHGWGPRRAFYLDRLARAVADAAGVRYALPTSSCTGAMHLALLTRGIGPGDEVIVPDLTWVATANAVALTGATPVFADIAPDSWGLDPDALRAAITERTRAVVPVHLYGYPARIDELTEIARDHDLFVLEDAAAAIGAALGNRTVGSWGDMAAFSFQGAKIVVAGEGGMLVTDDDALYERALYLLDQARDGPHPFHAGEVTPKYKMANVQAALALAQTERLPWLLERKRGIYDWYAETLHDIPRLRLHGGAAATVPTHWMPSIMLDPDVGVTRDQVIAELARRGVDSRPTFPPLSSLPMWSGAPGETPVTQSVAALGINLPSGVRLRRDEVVRVGSALREIIAPSQPS